MNVSMLPHHHRIFFQIGYIIERRLRPEFEEEPANAAREKDPLLMS